TKPTGRITDTTQGARHRTHCAACRIAHRPDNAAETAGPAATDTTQCASQRSDCACCRVRYRSDDAAKTTRRVATTDAAQCAGYRANDATKPTGRITDTTQGARHRTDCAACRIAHRPDNAAETAGPATT
ncbi:hypothetical protein SB462_34710, partial [Burkholderia sp. BCCIQ07C]|nr:hypothetical protein [Burkholderia anthinoferrum]